MKLPDDIISRVQMRTKHDLSSSIGCTLMARDIRSALGVYVCANTLKRTFGIIKSTSQPSKFTLDLIARHIGYGSWDEFLNDDSHDTSSFRLNEIIALDTVKPGAEVTFYYKPNRKVTMVCTGKNTFRITESLNGKLCVGDIVTAYSIALNHPLEFTSVIRNGCEMGNFTAGLHEGISAFEL